MSKDKIFYATGRLGIHFAASSSPGAVMDVHRALKSVGLPVTPAKAMVDGSWSFDVNTIGFPEGLPLSRTFVCKVLNGGGHFSGGNGLAPLLNRQNRPEARP